MKLPQIKVPRSPPEARITLLTLTAMAFALSLNSNAAPLTTTPTLISKDLQEFLGAPPKTYESKFRKPAHTLRLVLENRKQKKAELTIRDLVRLSDNSEMAEHAMFELANFLREKGEFAKSSTRAERILREFPNSTYADRLRDLLDANECDLGLHEAQSKPAAKKEEGSRLLQRCLARLSWKQWGDHEAEVAALYELLKKSKDPLLLPFVAEITQALPNNAKIRQKISQEIPAVELEGLATIARFRTKSPTAAGVKAINPDQELFDSAMKSVQKLQWKEANELFKRFLAEYPQSEHWERAQYWVARTDERIGNTEEARKRFEQIVAENPLTYYGLQSSLRLGQKMELPIAKEAMQVPKLTGVMFTRQALSLLRLRALLEEGLVSQAREEAKFLFQLKPGGSTVGQNQPDGALMMARLFQTAGFHQAAFSHAYAAISLDPALLNNNSLDYIFPRPFAKDFEAATALTTVNANLLLSVAKQESAFLPNALSRADALGLLQLLHNTAKEVVPGITKEELYQPGQNAIAGAKYLQKLLDRFQGNIALALAGYNAGPSRAATWQRELMETPIMKESFDVDAFIDSIPFSETRKYVGNILRNYAWYKLINNDGVTTNIQELIFQWQKTPEKQEVPSTTGKPETT